MLRPESKRSAADADADAEHDSEHDSPPRPVRRRSKVGFKLDSEAGFYGFVFSYADGSCVAHGGDAAHVGRTMAAIMESHEMGAARRLYP